MSSHTPGPWRVGDCRHEVWGHNPRNKTEANTFPDPAIANASPCDDINERYANARLIAAAPDLLDALAELDDLVKDLRAQTDPEEEEHFTTAQEVFDLLMSNPTDGVIDKARAAIAKATGVKG